MDDTFLVGHQHVDGVHSEPDEEPSAGHTSSPRTGNDDSRLGDVTTGDLHGVDERCPTDDGRPMLIVVENWNVEPLTQHRLDIEALGRLDVLQVDSPHRGG